MRKIKEDLKENVDLSLRPLLLEEYIGQEILKEKLRIYINAAKSRNEPLDHVLLYGPPGLGKTTLANIIANEMHGKIHTISGPSIEKLGDLAAVLSEIEPLDVLFIDEIHRLPRAIEESLYSVMEDFVFTILINSEDNCKSLTIHLPPFTLVGATTRPGNLSSALRERFGIVEKINFYSEEELSEIIIRTAKVFKLEISKQVALIIAKRSRGTPRICNKFFKRIRDYVTYKDSKIVTESDVFEMFKLLNIDEIGLDDVDLLYLKSIINRFNGGPVGIETLAHSIGEERVNLEDVYEPYLLKIGFIDKTNKGRIALKKCYKHLKIPYPNKR